MQNFGTITKKILSLERKYWNAMREMDLDAAEKLTEFPCLVVGANGVSSVSKQQFEKMFQASQGAMKNLDFDDEKAEVWQVNPNTAVIAYKVHPVQGKESMASPRDVVDTSTWVKRGNQWVCAMHTETELKKSGS